VRLIEPPLPPRPPASCSAADTSIPRPGLNSVAPTVKPSTATGFVTTLTPWFSVRRLVRRVPSDSVGDAPKALCHPVGRRPMLRAAGQVCSASSRSSGGGGGLPSQKPEAPPRRRHSPDQCQSNDRPARRPMPALAPPAGRSRPACAGLARRLDPVEESSAVPTTQPLPRLRSADRGAGAGGPDRRRPA
jgi:hypothetical protein